MRPNEDQTFSNLPTQGGMHFLKIRQYLAINS